jgi:cell volume regulation protein A
MTESGDFAVVLAVVSAGLWIALVSTRLTARLRVPAPVVFLIAAAAERIGVVALIAILFDGGLEMVRQTGSDPFWREGHVTPNGPRMRGATH